MDDQQKLQVLKDSLKLRKSELKLKITASIQDLFEDVLNYAEISIPTAHQYKNYRKKILRSGNDCIRNLTTFVDDKMGAIIDDD